MAFRYDKYIFMAVLGFAIDMSTLSNRESHIFFYMIIGILFGLINSAKNKNSGNFNKL